MELGVVAFNEEQKSAIGRALMAVANQGCNQSKIEPGAYQQNEGIELLSVSDNDAVEVEENGDEDADREMFVQMCDHMEMVKSEPQLYTEKIIASAIVETDIPDATNVCVEANDELPEQPVIHSDIIVVSAKKYRLTPNAPVTDNLQGIIDLDDDDENHCDYIRVYNDASNGDNGDVDVKEKKLVDLPDIGSDDEDNQPSTSNSQRNYYNLDAFLIYLCPQCGVTCGNIKKWNAHTDIVHNFRSISELNMKTVINKEGQLCYFCNTCNKRFNTERGSGVLLKHRITHMPIPHFLRCRLCDLRFSGRPHYLSHFRKAHKEIALRKLRRNEAIRRRHVEHSCPICKEIFEDYDEWVEHLDGKHDWQDKLQEKVTVIRDGVYECKTCAVTCLSRNMTWHLLLHEEHKPFKCKLCQNFDGNSITVMERHIRREHLKQDTGPKFPCKYCDQTFATYPQINRHTMEMHTIEKLTCDFCSKTFNSTSQLYVHMVKMNHQKIK
ncbi:zinc finger protein 660-like [Eurosta solidaginis]|uniref:zinc finger protein 660-like n=1 Tax=Eurosta solidaginis TaxID=178769 RepID=UPI003530AA2C